VYYFIKRRRGQRSSAGGHIAWHAPTWQIQPALDLASGAGCFVLRSFTFFGAAQLKNCAQKNMPNAP